MVKNPNYDTQVNETEDEKDDFDIKLRNNYNITSSKTK